MVRKLELDVGQICPRLCNRDLNQVWGHHPTLRDEGQVELAPLLCLIWGQGWAIDITFVQPASESTYTWTSKFHKNAIPAPGPPGASTSWYCRLPEMTDLLQALLRTKDSDTMDQPDVQPLRPHIRKYWRTIGSLCICRDGIGGIVGFKTTGPNGSWNMGPAASPNPEEGENCTDNISAFSFTEDQGGQVTWYRVTQPTLHTMPHHIQDQIMEYALSHPKNYKVNVTKEGLLSTFGAPLVKCSWHHRYPVGRYENGYVLAISSDSKAKNAKIEGFDTLHKLLRSRICTCPSDDEEYAHRSEAREFAH
jgi:hypothetical protein